MARSAVEGLQEFQQHMQEAAGSYALIDGTACDILLSEAGLPFRATHDFDVVIVADDRLPQTAEAIWTLVRDGGYRCGWGEGKDSCFYRFTEPKRPGYPHMIELFAKCPDFLKGREGIDVAPIHVDENISSLSAILLDDAYYSLFLQGIRTVGGVSVLGTEYIVPFKAKAYLDLKARREAGENVDSRKVKKHKRDALRLAQLLGESEGVDLGGELKDDMLAFVKDCEVGDVNLKQIGVAGVTMAQLLETMKATYGLIG